MEQGFEMVNINYSDIVKAENSNGFLIAFSAKPAVEQIETIRREFDAAVEAKVTEVIVDFENVDYLCSTSLAELVRMKKAALKYGISLSMIHVSAYIMEIFRTTRLLGFFQDET